jgi:hypothetical protein
MTFAEAYALFGPDVEAIAQELGIDPAEADRLINETMEAIHTQKIKREARKAYQREWMAKTRSNLREIRTGRNA